MADFDKLSDTEGIIINFIEEKVRGLFYGSVTPYEFSPWIQAALLFEQIIIPCDYLFPETLYELAQEVINEAESHKCKTECYGVKDGKKVNIEVFDYGETISKITEWLKKERIDRLL